MSSNGKLGTSAQAVPTNWSALDFGAATEAGIYSYTRLNEFLPFATIACEPDRSPLQEEIDSGLFHKILQTPFGPQTIEALFANPSGAPRGAIILHRGSIVLEHYGDISQYDRHIWMSTAKTWIGLLFSRLQDAGLVDCDATIGSVLKEAIGTAWANIRIRDALNMSTGLDVEETLAAQTDRLPLSHNFFWPNSVKMHRTGHLSTIDQFFSERRQSRLLERKFDIHLWSPICWAWQQKRLLTGV